MAVYKLALAAPKLALAAPKLALAEPKLALAVPKLALAAAKLILSGGMRMSLLLAPSHLLDPRQNINLSKIKFLLEHKSIDKTINVETFIIIIL
jgi:hypothetical protein